MNEWHTVEVNIKEEELLSKLKDGIGTRSNDYKLAMNKFREEIGRQVLIHPRSMFLKLSDKGERNQTV